MEKWKENSKWCQRRNGLLDAITLPEEGNLLDLSCSDGQFLEIIHAQKPKLKLTGIDISEERIKDAKKKYAWAHFSVDDVRSSRLPYKNFDTIFCNMSFHHYDNPLKMLSESKRLLKETGSLYIMDLSPKNRVSQIAYNIRGCNDDYHFEKYYTVEEFKKLAISTDLTIVKSIVLTALPRLVVLELKYQTI